MRLIAFLVLTSSLTVTSAQQISNGWIPITHEQAYRQNREENRGLNSKLKWLPTEQKIYIHSFRNDAINIIEPSLTEGIVSNTDNLDDYTGKRFGNCNTACLNTKEDKSLRQAKALASLKPKDESTSETTRNFANTDIYNVPKKEFFTPHIHNYEVTEKAIEDPIDKNEPIESQNKQQNNEVNIENANNEITEKLRRILIKYGIRSDDKLDNYYLSRVKNRDWFKLGHLSFDIKQKYQTIPTLDLLLLKYGVYLSSNYGIASNYRNFYGNSAFNNVHNNEASGI